MTCSALVFAYRKPGTTPAQFREHLENHHVPLIKSIAGSHFPISYTRRYIHRTEGTDGGPANPNYPATIMTGAQEAVDYDGFVELTFENEDAFMAFVGVVRQPDAAARIAADEEKFLDKSKMVIVRVGETIVTRKD